MSQWKEVYRKWMNYPNLDAEIRAELNALQGNEKLLEDCFYKNLEFGTGGMRGEIGPGPNRMNLYTIRKASQGLANYLLEKNGKAELRGVVIAYDSRHKSAEFAMEAAKTLASNGIRTYLFPELRPTPVLSFAVRHLKANAGIVITASHNPPEYNGYKVYGEDGGQIPPKTADELIQYVNGVENELELEVQNEQELREKGLIQMLDDSVDQAYLDHLLTLRQNPELIARMAGALKIVFTPLHGTSFLPIKRALEAYGFSNVTIVEEQAKPDPNFSTVSSPNPEEHAAFLLAIQYGKKADADILLATDPDADRLGVAVKDKEGEYVVLTGNQTGALLLHYLLSQKQEKGRLPANGVVLKTIVTSEIGRMIARDFGIDTVDTLTGFKFIGEKIKEYEQTGQYRFLFGYEESYGYLIGDFVRDKDAVQAALLAAETAAYYKSRGKTLYDGLMEIFAKYGYFREDLASLTLRGKEGAALIAAIMEDFRCAPPAEVCGKHVIAIEDYQSRTRVDVRSGKEEGLTLPKSNVLKYWLEDGSWFCLRPSGTEPKIKVYFGVRGESLQDSRERLQRLKEAVMDRIYSLAKA